MLQWPPWNKTEPARIACYVHKIESVRLFGEPPTAGAVGYDLQVADRLSLVRRAYEHLASRGIHYSTAEIDLMDFNQVQQSIRRPEEVAASGGNCLELSLIFAGLCQKLKLYPMVVLFERHALVAVRLDRDLAPVVDTLATPREDYPLMRRGLLTPGSDRDDAVAALIERADGKQWVFVECTGFAETKTLNGDTGTLSFDAALQRGAEQLEGNQLKDLVDVTYLQVNRLQQPYGPAMRVPAARSGIGRFGVEALHRWQPELPAFTGQSDIDDLDRVSTQDNALAGVVSTLRSALDATAFVRSWIPEALTTARLRSALGMVKPDLVKKMTAADDDRDYLTCVASHHRLLDGHCGPDLVSFVLALALDVGVEPLVPEFLAWAEPLVGRVAVNDLHDKVRRLHESARLRVLLSLHGPPTGGWPESIAVLLLDGDEVRASTAEPCAPNQRSVEKTIGVLLDWVDDLLGDSALQVSRIDVAVPTALLSLWRPEDAEIGSRLGLHHDVVVRWSERLSPPAHLSFAVREAGRRWPVIEQNGGVDWLADRDTRDLGQLLGHLRSGGYPGGLGLRFTPERNDELLELLLAFSPVLLWPDGETSCWDGIDDELRVQWTVLPAALARAYRLNWPPRREKTPLSGMRAVWDDQEWLTFCRKAKKRARIAPSGGAA
ncbi:hypothetical protein PV646_39320 [Streptomyces sp. ID05-26A]|nr:hypothetical protein [Streptomyces sp. ID05-26A]